MTLKIYLNNGDEGLVNVEDKNSALEVMKKYNLNKSDVLLLDENLEEVYI